MFRVKVGDFNQPASIFSDDSCTDVQMRYGTEDPLHAAASTRNSVGVSIVESVELGTKRLGKVSNLLSLFLGLHVAPLSPLLLSAVLLVLSTLPVLVLIFRRG